MSDNQKLEDDVKKYMAMTELKQVTKTGAGEVVEEIAEEDYDEDTRTLELFGENVLRECLKFNQNTTPSEEHQDFRKIIKGINRAAAAATFGTEDDEEPDDQSKKKTQKPAASKSTKLSGFDYSKLFAKK